MFEYLIVIYEYYKTCRKVYLLSNIAFSLVISSLVFIVSGHAGFNNTANKLLGNIISILGILIGFSISMFTLLNTASNPNIEEIKKKETEYKLYGKAVYLFDLLIISMIYIVIFESMLLVMNLVLPFFSSFSSETGKVIFCANIFLLTHIILVNVSTTVDFYFIITKKREAS